MMTGVQVYLMTLSETGRIEVYATDKLRPIIDDEESRTKIYNLAEQANLTHPLVRKPTVYTPRAPPPRASKANSL